MDTGDTTVSKTVAHMAGCHQDFAFLLVTEPRHLVGYVAARLRTACPSLLGMGQTPGQWDVNRSNVSDT